MALQLPISPLLGSRLWLAVASLAGAYIAVSPIVSWYRLRHIKGPWTAAWSSLWLLRRTSSSTLFEELGDACDQYGMFATPRLSAP